MDFPELAARTRRFSHGAPRAVSVAEDGSRVIFVPSAGPEDPADALWLLRRGHREERLVADPATLLGESGDTRSLSPGERALRERLRLSAAGIGSYALDAAGRVAVFALAGRLFRADLVTRRRGGGGSRRPGAGPTSGTERATVAYVTDAADGVRRGELRVIDPDGTETLLAGEDAGVSWGWPSTSRRRSSAGTGGTGGRRTAVRCSPPGSTSPAWSGGTCTTRRSRPARRRPSRTPGRWPNAEVSLHLLDLDDGWVDVHWDRETYPYLTGVSWGEGSPLITVLRRLAAARAGAGGGPRTGETQVHAELADPRWVEPIAGTPAHLPDGRVLVGGELAHDGYDARCLFADGTLLTPPSLYVRRVVDRLPSAAGPADLLVEASDGEPSERHLFRIRTTVGGGVDARRLTTDSGWYTAAVGGDVLAVGVASLDHAGVRWTIRRGDQEIAELRSFAATPPYAPLPMLERVTDRRLPAAVLYPDNHVTGRRLPVLLDIYGGPGHKEVVAARAAWLERQWWPTPGSRWSPSTTGVRRAWRRRSRRRSTVGSPT